MSLGDTTDEPKRVFYNNGGIISSPKKTQFTYRNGLGYILFEKMKENGNKIAQIDVVTGQIDTYDVFLQRCIRAAIVMRSKGLTQQDLITVCSNNHLDTFVPVIASLFLGIKYANLDPALSLEDSAHVLNLVRPKMIFVSSDAVKLIEDTLRKVGITAELVVFDAASQYTPFSDFLTASPEETNFRPVVIKDMKETAAIYFSSGTTGLAKGICVKHAGLLSAPPNSSEQQVIFLSYSSIYWISLVIFAISAILSSGCRLVVPAFDYHSMWSYIKKYKVNSALLTPTQVAMICQNGLPEDADVSSLKFCMSGGSAVSKEQVETMRKLFYPAFVITSYGQTELGTGCLVFDISSKEEIQLALRKPSSCGRPSPGISVKIVDPETEEILGFNQEGEIRIKSENYMNGYYKADSSSAWDSDGFLKTGDILYYDEDYCFFVVDRIKEMLKFQGWQIPPAKLEAVLLSHPAVECALVIGLPHPVDVDHPMGIVTLGKTYVGKVSAEEIQKYVDDRVSHTQKLRGGVKIVTSIPVTPSGKYKRRHIKNMVLNNEI